MKIGETFNKRESWWNHLSLLVITQCTQVLNLCKELIKESI